MKKLLLATIFVLTSIFTFSQVANYVYTATTSTWAANATPTVITGLQSTSSADVNDVLSAAINIGFTFNYGFTDYTQFKASENGFITFNTANTSSQPTNNLNTSTERTIVAVLWDDNNLTYNSSPYSNVNYKLTGTSPSRVLTIEWSRLTWIKTNNTSGTINCQIKLYETTNVIEFIYDRSTTGYSLTNNPTTSIGLGGPTSGDFLSLSDLKASTYPTSSNVTETSTIGTTPMGLISGSSNNSTNNKFSSAQLTTRIGNGTKYRFTPPLVNDNCSGAIAMTVNSGTTCTTTTSGTTVGGTQSSTACSGTADEDVWYKFTATQASHDLRETPGTIGDAVVQLYSGTCASLTSISCIDNYSVSDETYSATGLTSGNTYYVRVHSYGNGTGQGTFTMCVTSPCLGTPTSSAGTSVTSTSFSANWSAVSGVSSYLLDVATNNTFTTMVSGYSALSVGNVTTYSVTGLSASTTYYFRVRVDNSICTNSTTQTVITKPANDESASAITVTANSTGTCTTTTTSTTIGATQTLAAQSSYGTADDDVWYKFVATAPSLDMTVSLGTIGDLVVEAYTSSLVSIGVVDGSFSTESVSFTGLTIGSTYYFRIYSFGSSVSNRGTFTICLATPPEIATSGTLTSFSSCSGTVSSEKSFSITGYGLLANITLTAPTGFELSTTSGGTFTSPITLTQSGGGVSATTIYVRMKSNATGSPSGDISCASTSATTQTVAASGLVTTSVTPAVSASGTSSICSGTSVTFTATPTNGGAGPSYQWKLNGGNVGTNSTAYSNAGLANGDIVSVVMTANNICQTESTGTSNSTTMSVSQPSVGGTVTPNQTVSSGGTASTISLTGNTGSVVKWQYDVASTFTTAVDVTNTTTSVLGSSMGSFNQTKYYRAVVQNGTCSSINSSYVKITVATGLPIELLYFNGTAHGRINNLYWSTASENNNDYFNIEKSSDDEIWVDIDKQKGAGNSSTQLYYSFSDNNVEKIINYYRLKQTDYDGNFKYSDIISIDNRDNDSKEIYRVVNVLGQEVDLQYYRGLVIIEYSDGSSIKIIK